MHQETVDHLLMNDDRLVNAYFYFHADQNCGSRSPQGLLTGNPFVYRIMMELVGQCGPSRHVGKCWGASPTGLAGGTLNQY